MKLIKIKLKLGMENLNEFSYQKASLMQGALMEWLPSDYVEKLHESSLNPYSQYLEKKKDEWYWNIRIFQEEAVEQIYTAIMNPSRNKLHLKHGDLALQILEKDVEVLESRELMQKFYFQDMPRNIQIRFKTPTAFKKNGEYIFYPDISCIIKSMLTKYDAVTACEGKADPQMVEELVKNTRISQYQIRSCNFSLEGVRIPAFVGEVKFYFRGSQTLSNYMHFLFHFAEYSGIGIKAAMGMGAIEVQEKKGEVKNG